MVGLVLIRSRVESACEVGRVPGDGGEAGGEEAMVGDA